MRIFRKIFQDNFNIGFHVPKKDKCLKCLQYENNNNPEKQKEKEEHEIEKEESYARFKVHEHIHKDDPQLFVLVLISKKYLTHPMHNLCFCTTVEN